MSSDRSIACPPTTALSAVFCGGLVAGILDLAFAGVSFALRGKTFATLLKVVAGGALGPSAMRGGAGTAALGLAFHFVISFGAAAVYSAAVRRMPEIRRRWWLTGPTFGLLVYEFMHLVVLPLSAYHTPLALPSLLVPDVLSHLFLVGLPIAFFASGIGPHSGNAPGRSAPATRERSNLRRDNP